MSIMLLVKHKFKTFWSLEFVLIVVYLSRAKVSSVLHLEKTILYLKKNQFFNLTVFENHQKCRIWYIHFWHFYNFWPIKIDLSGSTVWLQFSSLRSQSWMRLFLWFSNNVLWEPLWPEKSVDFFHRKLKLMMLRFSIKCLQMCGATFCRSLSGHKDVS